MEISRDEPQKWDANNYQTELMPDEKLLSRVLHSKKLHKKAKLVINEKLNQLNRQSANRDMYETEIDFAKLQELIFSMIIQEDPLEA